MDHARALALMASSHVLVISSRMEGGANVVSEALRIGVPVIASRIPGNTGLLGRDWPALYPVGDERALARLLARFATDTSFRARLARRTSALRDTVSPASEARMLRAAVEPQPPRTRRTGAKLRR
jgi:glycosyltransferase involved in cell wall biosynthesis